MTGEQGCQQDIGKQIEMHQNLSLSLPSHPAGALHQLIPLLTDSAFPGCTATEQRDPARARGAAVPAAMPGQQVPGTRNKPSGKMVAPSYYLQNLIQFLLGLLLELPLELT